MSFLGDLFGIDSETKTTPTILQGPGAVSPQQYTKPNPDLTVTTPKTLGIRG